jgi:hypothetical protein
MIGFLREVSPVASAPTRLIRPFVQVLTRSMGEGMLRRGGRNANGVPKTNTEVANVWFSIPLQPAFWQFFRDRWASPDELQSRYFRHHARNSLGERPERLVGIAMGSKERQTFSRAGAGKVIGPPSAAWHRQRAFLDGLGGLIVEVAGADQ